MSGTRSNTARLVDDDAGDVSRGSHMDFHEGRPKFHRDFELVHGELSTPIDATLKRESANDHWGQSCVIAYFRFWPLPIFTQL